MFPKLDFPKFLVADLEELSFLRPLFLRRAHSFVEHFTRFTKVC